MTHIQNTAPGPPAIIAPATPTILPVPTVAASAVHRLWNWEMLLSRVWVVTCLSWKTAPMVFLIQWPKCVTWNTLVSTVISTPTNASSARAGTPHTASFTAPLTFATVSRIPPSAAAAPARSILPDSSPAHPMIFRFISVPAFPLCLNRKTSSGKARRRPCL